MSWVPRWPALSRRKTSRARHWTLIDVSRDGGWWVLRVCVVKRLSKCTLVTDAGVVALAECTKLSYLDLAFCKQAGDGGVAMFIRSAAGNSSSSSGALQVLDLSSTSITTATVDLVATYCPGLQCLRINQCEAITSASVEAVVEGCSSLRELGLSGCSNVATSDARRLQAGRPGLLLSR